jgi:hypothetical protein
VNIAHDHVRQGCGVQRLHLRDACLDAGTLVFRNAVDRTLTCLRGHRGVARRRGDDAPRRGLDVSPLASQTIVLGPRSLRRHPCPRPLRAGLSDLDELRQWLRVERPPRLVVREPAVSLVDRFVVAQRRR